MKVIDIIGGWRIPISNEENVLLDLVKNSSPCKFINLNDRQRQLAFELYKRSVLLITDDGDITYNKKKDLTDIDW